MNDEELLDERARIFDAAEVAESGSELYAFVRWAAAAIAVEMRLRTSIRDGVWQARPDLDPRVVAEAFGEILQFHLELTIESDVDELFAAALEVAERRGRDERADVNE